MAQNRPFSNEAVCYFVILINLAAIHDDSQSGFIISVLVWIGDEKFWRAVPTNFVIQAVIIFLSLIRILIFEIRTN